MDVTHARDGDLAVFRAVGALDLVVVHRVHEALARAPSAPEGAGGGAWGGAGWSTAAASAGSAPHRASDTPVRPGSDRSPFGVLTVPAPDIDLAALRQCFVRLAGLYASRVKTIAPDLLKRWQAKAAAAAAATAAKAAAGTA